MTQSIMSALQEAPVVPLVTPDDVTTAVKTTQALIAGGLKAIEVVLRTDNGMAVFGEMIKEMPDVLIGSGTVLSAEQAQKTVDLGAKFIVSPGLDEGVVKVGQSNNIPVFPGIATASELQKAHNLGLEAVKFFPAGSAGGPKMIKDLSGPFRHMSFMPTGGVSAANLKEYLDVPAVIACGGSWLTPKDAIATGDFAAVTKLAQDALVAAGL